MSDARMLDHGTPPERFARGWHCLGLADSFRDGKPHRVEAFGGQLVVWEDTQGNLNVLDGYCRHMGGDLTQGTVKGDEIACPFHDWRWGGDGRCKQIPYARRVPLRARTQKYSAVIRNDQLLVWHDVENSEPDMDILPPVLPGLDDGLYTDWTWEIVPITDSHCRELIDNVVDMAHFYYVHFSFPTSFRNVFEGTQATQFMESKGRPDKAGGYGSPDLFLKSEATYFGPAYMINWLDVDYKGFQTEVILINCHIPTGPDSFTLQYGITVKRPEGIDDDTAAYISKKYAADVRRGLPAGRAHLEEQGARPEPAALRGGRPGLPAAPLVRAVLRGQGRHRPEMVDRFEFEVDTTKANEYWQEEVAENLRLRAEVEADV